MARPRRNRLWLWMSLVFVNIIAVLCLAEIGGTLLFYLDRGAVFYWRQQTGRDAMPEPLEVKDVAFHPYFSFLNRVGRSGDYYERKDWWTSNNHGFLFPRAALKDGCCDYPYIPQENEAVIAIFGGSVGGGFALTAADSDAFAATLSQHPRFAGRRIRVLTFANAGYHQPQQLVILSYYLTIGQHFDLIINIDGFNELVIAENNWRAGAEPSFPAVQIWYAMGQELESRATAAADEKYYLQQWHKRASARLAEKADRCRFGACYLWYAARQRYHAMQQAALGRHGVVRQHGMTLFPMQRSWSTGDDPRQKDVLAYAADGWARASRAMERLARDHGALYLHVIQPNQWYAADPAYQPHAIDHPYKAVIPLVERGYPMLVQRTAELARDGVHVFDATKIFAGLDLRDIYADDCCHYTDEGYRVLFKSLEKPIAALR